MERNQHQKRKTFLFYWLLCISLAVVIGILISITLSYVSKTEKEELKKETLIKELELEIAEMQSAQEKIEASKKPVDNLDLKLLNENLLIFEKKVKEQSETIKNNDNKIKELEGLVNQTEEECLLCLETLKRKTEIIEELEYLLLVKDVIDPDDNSFLSSFGSVNISPDGFFRDFIEVVSQANVAEAILRNRNGIIIREFKDPKIINTSDISPGVYYLSFYNEQGELIQAAKAVCKR